MAEKRITRKTKAPGKGHRGIRFVLTLLILAAAAGTTFYFGWVQFQLDAGQYGVVYTKSHGWEEKVLVNGEFEWRWQALLPTNLTLHVYESMPRRAVIERGGILPSGEFYSNFVGEGVRFDWNIKAEIVYRIDPNALAALAEGGVGPSELAGLYAEYESRLGGLVDRIVDRDAAELDIREFERELKDGAGEIDERFEVMRAAALDWRYPDPVLYDQARRLALDLLKERQNVLSEVEEAAIRREDVQSARIDLLARYGKVLSDHPILLDLFALEGNPGISLLSPSGVE